MPELTDEELGIPASLEDPNIRAELRQSRITARERDTAQSEASAAQRELAFLKAGVPETGTGALLRTAYSGELTTEAIQKAAADNGIELPGSGSSSDEEAAAAAEMERIRQISQGGGSGTFAPTVNANQAFVKALAENRRRVEKHEITVEAGTREAWDIIERLGPQAGVRRFIQ